ncbi:hypothetical protein BKA63DRAFT_505694 [Paraphoma chrysanthemicola]|nr:hypothetical protein BKA63DRAFT_505694 [Paraphoma chrysanthemicola]
MEVCSLPVLHCFASLQRFTRRRPSFAFACLLNNRSCEYGTCGMRQCVSHGQAWRSWSWPAFSRSVSSVRSQGRSGPSRSSFLCLISVINVSSLLLDGYELSARPICRCQVWTSVLLPFTSRPSSARGRVNKRLSRRENNTEQISSTNFSASTPRLPPRTRIFE